MCACNLRILSRFRTKYSVTQRRFHKNYQKTVLTRSRINPSTYVFEVQATRFTSLIETGIGFSPPLVYQFGSVLEIENVEPKDIADGKTNAV